MGRLFTPTTLYHLFVLLLPQKLQSTACFDAPHHRNGLVSIQIQTSEVKFEVKVETYIWR